MSLIICVHVEEGLVLASDSRITYNNTINVDNVIINNMGVHMSDSNSKTFLCPNNCGISTCGVASINGNPISGIVEKFILENININTSIEEMPELIKKYFLNYEPKLNTNFIVAGYTEDQGKYIQKIYKINILNETIENIETNVQGALWDGEILTLTKLLTPVQAILENGTVLQLPHNQISWNYYTLQDAVDFSRYAIKTTIDTMHFENSIETVGYPIDILVIKPKEAIWLNQKKLK